MQRILLQNAERLIRVAKNRMRTENLLMDNAYVMPTESWSRYKYLFVRDFDRDQWDAINTFYDNCALYDQAVAHKSASFQKNEEILRANMHRVSADYVQQFIEGGVTNTRRKKLLTKINSFQDEYLGLPPELNLYTPQKPSSDAKALLDGIADDLSQKAIGGILKKLANNGGLLRRIFGR